MPHLNWLRGESLRARCPWTHRNTFFSRISPPKWSSRHKQKRGKCVRGKPNFLTRYSSVYKYRTHFQTRTHQSFRYIPWRPVVYCCFTFSTIVFTARPLTSVSIIRTAVSKTHHAQTCAVPNSLSAFNPRHHPGSSVRRKNCVINSKPSGKRLYFTITVYHGWCY